MDKTEQVAWEGAVDWDRVKEEEIKELGQTADSPLVGLAFSGGGIRSATFNLGVLEHLREKGLLEKVDFLSTVSGGGYIGAWLAANIKNHGGWLKPGADWSASIRHLRRYSNYLSPHVGFFSADTWTMLTVWLRNAILIQLCVALTIAAVMLVPRLTRYAFISWPTLGPWRGITFALFLLSVAGIAANLLRMQRDQASILRANAWPRYTAGAAVAALLTWWTGAQFAWFTITPVAPLPAMACALFAVLTGFLLVPGAARVLKQVEVHYNQGWTQTLVVLPMMVCAFFVASILFDFAFDSELAGQSYGHLLATAWSYWTFPLTFVFSSLLLLGLVSVRSGNPLYWAWGVLAPMGAMGVLYALLCGIQLILSTWTIVPGSALASSFHALVWGPPMVLFAFSLTVVLFIGLLGRASAEDRREWWSRLGAWLCIYGIGWLLICVPAIYAPLWLGMLAEAHSGFTIPAAGGWLVTTIGGLLAGNAAGTSGQERNGAKSTAMEMLAKTAPFLFVAGVLVQVAAMNHLFLLHLNTGLPASVKEFVHAYWGPWADVTMSSTLIFLGLVTLALVILVWRVDINEFSLNAFYRNRLVRCYLGATNPHRYPQNFTGFDLKDDPPLDWLRREHGYTGPLPIVNCALNLGSTSDLDMHTRHSASFVLTPLFCGSHRPDVRYYPTAPKKGVQGQEPYAGDGVPTLGQAISVSGAAASPNMGFHTSPVVAFLLTVFNVRLGWWFPRPAGPAVNRPAPWFSLRYLVKELFGSAGEESNFLMVSDGGHFENLAVYELVRRECDVIICGDGECDPEMHFGSLATVIRMCETDHGARIEVNVDSLKRDAATGLSHSHCAVGRIRYRSGKQGTLIYLKSSVTGDEPTDVQQYRSEHQAFPHESTGDQFFAEDQFESYRKLGYHVTESALREVTLDEDLRAPLVRSRLRDLWTPSLSASSKDHTARLASIWSRLADDDELDFLDAELFPELAQGTQPAIRTAATAEARRRAFYLCGELLQLMEDVFADLKLHDTFGHPDHEGWQQLFLQWSKSPSVCDAWEKTATRFGKRFQYFAISRLGMKGARSAGA